MEPLTPQVMHKLVFTILVHGLPPAIGRPVARILEALERTITSHESDPVIPFGLYHKVVDWSLLLVCYSLAAGALYFFLAIHWGSTAAKKTSSGSKK